MRSILALVLFIAVSTASLPVRLLKNLLFNNTCSTAFIRPPIMKTVFIMTFVPLCTILGSIDRLLL